MVASPLATCNIRQRADQWHLKNRAASSARPRGSRPARVGKSVAATSERDAAADAPADDEADRQRERHDDARVPALPRTVKGQRARMKPAFTLSAVGKSL